MRITNGVKHMNNDKVIGTIDGVVAWYDGTYFDYSVEEMERIIKENGLEVGDRIKLTVSVDSEEQELEEITKEVDNYMEDPVASKLMNRNAALGLARHFVQWQKDREKPVSNESPKWSEEDLATIKGLKEILTSYTANRVITPAEEAAYLKWLIELERRG